MTRRHREDGEREDLDGVRYTPAELRTLALRTRTLLLVLYASLLARVLLTLVAFTFHLDTRFVTYAGLLLTVWLAYFFFGFCTAAKLPSPWLYLMAAVLVCLLLPLPGLLLVGFLAGLVSVRVFRPRGVPLGPLGPDARALR